MIDQTNLILYYFIKRLFLFLDEWLFYYTLIRFFTKKYYKTTFFIFIYGISCIYTSYSNIDKIESNITNSTQIIFLTNNPYEYFNQTINNVINILNLEKN